MGLKSFGVMTPISAGSVLPAVGNVGVLGTSGVFCVTVRLCDVVFSVILPSAVFSTLVLVLSIDGPATTTFAAMLFCSTATLAALMFGAANAFQR